MYTPHTPTCTYTYVPTATQPLTSPSGHLSLCLSTISVQKSPATEDVHKYKKKEHISAKNGRKGQTQRRYYEVKKVTVGHMPIHLYTLCPTPPHPTQTTCEFINPQTNTQVRPANTNSPTPRPRLNHNDYLHTFTVCSSCQDNHSHCCSGRQHPI